MRAGVAGCLANRKFAKSTSNATGAILSNRSEFPVRTEGSDIADEPFREKGGELDLPDPYGRLIRAGESDEPAAVADAMHAIWQEVSTHRTRALHTVTRAGERSPEALRALAARIVLATASSEKDEPRHRELSDAAKRTIAALEIPATPVNRGTAYNLIFAAFIFGVVMAFNRLGWGAIPYILAAFALILVFYNYVTSIDYERVMRPRFLDALLRYRMPAHVLFQHLDVMQKDLPSLAAHRGDIAKDLPLVVLALLASWQGMRERETAANSESAVKHGLD